MEICIKKPFLWSKFHYHGNNMELLIKFYTIIHSHYHHLVPLTKRAVRTFEMLLAIFSPPICKERVAMEHVMHQFSSYLNFSSCNFSLLHPSFSLFFFLFNLIILFPNFFVLLTFFSSLPSRSSLCSISTWRSWLVEELSPISPLEP